MECLQNVGIESSSFSGYSGEIYLNNSLNNSLPIFPTTDYDRCVSYMKDYANPNNTLPYDNGQIGNFNISKNLTNPIGMINKETNSFTPITGNRYFDIVNGTTDAKCVLSDEDVAKYILKNPGKLCNGNGTFVQDKDQNGRYLPSGKCSCNQTYKGTNCQYSVCGGNGIVNNEGTCVCVNGYAGSYCQYSDAVTCRGNGKVNNDGTCVCGNGPIDKSMDNISYYKMTGKNCELTEAICQNYGPFPKGKTGFSCCPASGFCYPE
jgi:hypothetical protein